MNRRAFLLGGVSAVFAAPAAPAFTEHTLRTLIANAPLKPVLVTRQRMLYAERQMVASFTGFAYLNPDPTDWENWKYG